MPYMSFHIREDGTRLGEGLRWQDGRDSVIEGRGNVGALTV